MSKRTILFESPSRLHLKDLQLIAENQATGEMKRAPVEDIGVVLVENQQVTVTVPLLNALAKNNCAVVFCDDRHMPVSMLLTLDSNMVQAETHKLQVDVTSELKGSLWKQTVEMKIRNQAALLDKLGLDGEPVRSCGTKVKPGDSSNREGVAAGIYWDALFGMDFIRSRFGGDANPLLNYGYTVLRAAMARAIMCSGLSPAFGLYHKNRYNAFPLADDLMEPYRPFVDDIVLGLTREGTKALDKEAKRSLLGVLVKDVRLDDIVRPLAVGMTLTTASLCRCLRGEDDRLKYPEFR